MAWKSYTPKDWRKELRKSEKRSAKLTKRQEDYIKNKVPCSSIPADDGAKRGNWE